MYSFWPVLIHRAAILDCEQRVTKVLSRLGAEILSTGRVSDDRGGWEIQLLSF